MLAHRCPPSAAASATCLRSRLRSSGLWSTHRGKMRSSSLRWPNRPSLLRRSPSVHLKATVSRSPLSQWRFCMGHGGRRSFSPSLRATPRALTLSRSPLGASQLSSGVPSVQGRIPPLRRFRDHDAPVPTAPPANLTSSAGPDRRATKRPAWARWSLRIRFAEKDSERATRGPFKLGRA